MVSCSLHPGDDFNIIKILGYELSLNVLNVSFATFQNMYIRIRVTAKTKITINQNM